MSRLLWLSNAPWSPSGYGEQTALFMPRLAALGHDVACLANFGVTGKVDTWNGFTVYPSDGYWGNQNIATWAPKHQADAVIALCDSFILKPDDWADDLRMAVWAPVDHYPIPPAILAVLAHEKITPIAMSRFGERMMRDCELDPLYVPHGVDTALFRPRPGARDAARDALQIPRDAFLVGMVAANKAGSATFHRKGFAEAFGAFGQFARSRPDAWMYAHTKTPVPGGWNLERLAGVSGVPEGRLRFPSDQAWDLGISRDILATLYQAFDVLLAPSMGEGFGIPILEAQACGIPVIASDHSAMTELTQTGWRVAGQPLWDEASCAYFIQPYIHSIVMALEQAYEEARDPKMKQAAADFALTYDADLVTTEFWEPALERILPQPESRQVRRARERAEAKKRDRVAA